MAGYLDVEVDHVLLEREIGPRCIFFSQEAWIGIFQEVLENDVRRLGEELRHYFAVVDLTEDELLRSARVALALERYVTLESLDAVTINCHTSYFRHNEQVAIIACFAASRLTTAGVPVACTGDILTTVAMLIGKVLGAPVLYCECDLIDYDRGVMVMANTGEADFGLCERGSRIMMVRNTHFGPGKQCGGGCHFLRIKPGPATLLGFSPNALTRGGWNLIAATGRILGTIHDKLMAGNCEFEFDRKPVKDAFNLWVRAGATHHGALCAGDWRREICSAAEMLGIGGEVIA
jgi:L-fucose isomerase-like protein